MNAILNSNVYQSSGTCNGLQTFAFSSHPSCYIDKAHCSSWLHRNNLNCLSVEVIGYFDYDFFRKMAFQQVTLCI